MSVKFQIKTISISEDINMLIVINAPIFPMKVENGIWDPLNPLPLWRPGATLLSTLPLDLINTYNEGRFNKLLLNNFLP